MPDPTRDLPPRGDPTAAPSADGLTADPTTGGTRPPESPAPTATGTAPVVPGYELLEEVGRGGMGVVYRARDLAFGRDVAVKLLQDRYPADGPSARRFVGEAHVTAQLQHPGIPPVHQVGTTAGGRPFLAMKLIKGRTLDDLIQASGGRQPPDGSTHQGADAPRSPNLVAAFEKVCEAVGYAHAHGVVHRDLKPQNVMVGAFGEVQVMDWGLAKVLADRRPDPGDPEATAPATEFVSTRDPADATRAGSLLGTPAYMPPEQAIGAVDEVDARSDVFGLGGILCAVLTGKPPYLGDTAEGTRKRAARADLTDALGRLDACGADPELVALCKRCLSAEKADRPADAGEVAAEVARLRAAADERAKQAELDRVRADGERAKAEAEAREQRKRRRAQLALAAAVGLLVLGGGAFAWWQDRQAADRRAEEARLEGAARQERAVRDERARAGVEAALASLPELYRRFLFAQAGARLDEADALLGPDGDPGLREKVAAAKRDTAFIARLDRIRMGVLSEMMNAGGPDESLRRVETAFREHGLEVTTGRIPDLADRVAASAALDYLIAALDDWALWLPPSSGTRERLFALTAGATGHAWRVEFAAALAAGDLDRAAAVYDAAPPDHRTPSLARAVGAALYDRDRGRRLADGLLRHPDDFWLHMFHASITGRRGLSERRAGAYRAALALRPDNAWVVFGLGLGLERAGDPDGALACYQKAARIEPGNVDLLEALGDTLKERRDYAGALAAYRQAAALAAGDPKYAVSVGAMLLNLGRTLEAEAELLRAIRLDGADPWANALLAEVLKNRGQFADALHLIRPADESITRREGPKREFVDSLREYEGLVRLDVRLEAVTAGPGPPPTPAEAVELANFALQPYKRRYYDSFRLYTAAFAAEPPLAAHGTNRYDAACAAVRLAAGDDPSAAVGWDEWGVAQDQAFAWLTAQLAEFRRLAVSADPAERGVAAGNAAHWQKDEDMAPVREPARRAWMPAPDRARWEKFWAEVEAVRASALPPVAPPPREAKR